MAAQLLRNNPGLGAYAVMALDSGGADRELDAAGRRHDDYVNAERPGVAGFGHRFIQIGLITMQHIAIHGARPRPDARAHIAADRAHQEKRDDRGTPSVETRALQYAARMAVHDVDILIATAGAAHRAASWLPGAAVSFGDYELLGDAANIMARQRTGQQW
jgi:hypothetical protein